MSSLLVWPLKHELKRKLDRSRTADLVKLVQTAIRLIQGRQRLPKSTLADDPIDVAEIWMVEDVEKLTAKLNVYTLGKIKLAMQSEVCLPPSGTAHHVPAQGSLGLCGCTIRSLR